MVNDVRRSKDCWQKVQTQLTAQRTACPLSEFCVTVDWISYSSTWDHKTFSHHFLHPTKTVCRKRLCLIVLCVSSYRWVHFPRSVLFCKPQQQLFTHSLGTFYLFGSRIWTLAGILVSDFCIARRIGDVVRPGRTAEYTDSLVLKFFKFKDQPFG